MRRTTGSTHDDVPCASRRAVLPSAERSSYYFEDRTAFAVDTSVSTAGAMGRLSSWRSMSADLSRTSWPRTALTDGAGALVGLSLALAAVFGVFLLRRYEVKSPVYRKAASGGSARAGGKVLLFASPTCGALASSHDQPSAAVETYLLLAGIEHEKRLGDARKAPRGSVRDRMSDPSGPTCMPTGVSTAEAPEPVLTFSCCTSFRTSSTACSRCPSGG